MKRIPGGVFLMGTDSDEAWQEDGEGPVRSVTLSPFDIDEAAVTCEQFTRFVEETGYQTDAERFGWSYVFHLLLPRKYLESLKRQPPVYGATSMQWWVVVPGASWKTPLGPRSNCRQLMDHPVTHVSWHDAQAYARWAGKQLPTEAQWEYAARGGLVQATYPWGDQLTPMGKHRCNIWQGRFPHTNTLEDGYLGTCPVKAFPPNSHGLYNMAGNVWEWTQDWFSPTWHRPDTPDTRLDPQGPQQGHLTRKVQKGGSFLCHASYCNRYRVAARTSNTPDSTAANAGFRCVRPVAAAATP